MNRIERENMISELQEELRIQQQIINNKNSTQEEYANAVEAKYQLQERIIKARISI